MLIQYLILLVRCAPSRFHEFLSAGSLKSLDDETALDLLDWTMRAQNISDGSHDWLDTCGKGSLEYQECPGNYRTVWRRRYSALFDILMVIYLYF